MYNYVIRITYTRLCTARLFDSQPTRRCFTSGTLSFITTVASRLFYQFNQPQLGAVCTDVKLLTRSRHMYMSQYSSRQRRQACTSRLLAPLTSCSQISNNSWFFCIVRNLPQTLAAVAHPRSRSLHPATDVTPGSADASLSPIGSQRNWRYLSWSLTSVASSSNDRCFTVFPVSITTFLFVNGGPPVAVEETCLSVDVFGNAHLTPDMSPQASIAITLQRRRTSVTSRHV